MRALFSRYECLTCESAFHLIHKKDTKPIADVEKKWVCPFCKTEGDLQHTATGEWDLVRRV